MNLESIERAKQQWEFVADSMPMLICLVDSRLRIVRTNRTIERWGLGDVAAVKGLSLHETLHPGCTAPDCPLRELEQDAIAGLDEAKRAHMEGFDPRLRRHVAINVQPILDDDDERNLDGARAVVSVDDVSELKRSEKGVLCLQSSLRLCIVQEVAKRMEIEEVQSRLLTILSRTPNFIAMADADGKIFYLNHAGRVMLGLEDDYHSQVTLADCLAPEALDAMFSDVLPTALRQGVWRGPSALLARNGRRLETTQVVIAHRAVDGTPTGFSIVEQDMTAWVEAEAALRSSQEELQRLSAQLLDVQETERRRIAGDLHDVIGQSLSFIKLSIESACQLVVHGEAPDAIEALHRVSGKVKDALLEVQRVSMDLRPSTLDDLGILPTLSWFFREFEATCPRIKVGRQIKAQEERIQPPLKTAIFRILQEATANIVKHAQADRIDVELTERGGFLELVIADNGRGFNPADVAERSRRGLGLRSMQERARLSGGTFSLDAVAGEGTRIRVRWPL